MQVNELLEHSLVRMQGRHSPEAEQILRALPPGLASNEHDILPAAPLTREDGYVSKLASNGFMVRPSPTLSRDAPWHHEILSSTTKVLAKSMVKYCRFSMCILLISSARRKCSMLPG